MLFPPLPQKGTRTFWIAAKQNFSEITGEISASGKTPFRVFQAEQGYYRITQLRFSSNWSAPDYSRCIANTITEGPYTTSGNIVDAYNRSITDGPFDLTEYFDNPWIVYWNNNNQHNQLYFQYNLNLIPDPDIVMKYGSSIELRCFVQLQQFNDSRWIEAIEGGKI